MGIPTLLWLRNIGIGGRLFLAFVLISSITIVASGLSTNTYLQLSDRLLLLKYQDIPGLDAAARLNDKSRLIVATAPLLVTSDAAISREQTMAALSLAISEMDALMRNLPDYNRYFLELITQIQNSLTLLNQSVERREVIRRELAQSSLLIFPLFEALIQQLNQLERSAELEQVIHRLHYFSGLMEKISNDASFNELDYTFLRLEKLGGNRSISDITATSLTAFSAKLTSAFKHESLGKANFFNSKTKNWIYCINKAFYLKTVNDIFNNWPPKSTNILIIPTPVFVVL
ncbi:hypothetical protein AB8616_12685 [Marinomonas sp. RS-M-Aa-14]|uniref:hypothetical protein n=1 Tax=Marinomonas sp. RS-M-Aa-14 TaxID=3241169 RepID=UPI003AAF0936